MPVRFLGAFKVGHRYSVQEFVDEDLSWKLLRRIEDSEYRDSEAVLALDYLARFYNELYRGVLKKGDSKALHTSPDLYRAAVNARNAQRRCVHKASTYSLDSEENTGDEDIDRELAIAKRLFA